MDGIRLRKRIKRILIILVHISCYCLLVSCLKTQETTLDRAKRERVLRIGYANDIPYGYKTADGYLTGEAPEIARRILADMGIPEIEGVFTEFGSLIPALKAGRFDMIAAGMFILVARQLS